MRTDDLKRSILRLFQNQEHHGYDVRGKLAEEGEEVELSRLYRVLNDMSRDGLLEGRWEKSQRGPRKRVYILGEKGLIERKKMLMEAIELVHSHYDEYIMTLPSEQSVFDIIVKKFSRELPDPKIAIITPFFATIHRRLITTIDLYIPEATIYLIMPSTEEIDLSLPNLIQMKGFFNNIPLKKDMVDLLIIIGVPTVDSLRTSIAEWKRSLKPEGRLAIITPTVLIEEFQHPMHIGNYIEFIEHTDNKRFETPNKETLERVLENNFSNIKKDKIIHLTIYMTNYKP